MTSLFGDGEGRADPCTTLKCVCVCVAFLKKIKIKIHACRHELERESGDVLPGGRTPLNLNSFRGPRVLRAWERGELFFPAKKEQGSNNTVLRQKKLALCAEAGACDHPDTARDTTRRTGAYLGAGGVSTSFNKK